MELQFDSSVNKAHEKWAEQERKRVRAIKNAQIEKDERDYYISRSGKKIMLGLLVAGGLATVLIAGKVIDDKLTDRVYITYGAPTGTMRHPETHELQKYWEIDGKNYYISDLKWKSLFDGAKTEKDSSLVTNHTPHEGDLMGETKPLGGK